MRTFRMVSDNNTAVAIAIFFMARLQVKGRGPALPAKFILECLMGREALRKRLAGYSLVTLRMGKGKLEVTSQAKTSLVTTKTKGWKRRPS